MCERSVRVECPPLLEQGHASLAVHPRDDRSQGVSALSLQAPFRAYLGHNRDDCVLREIAAGAMIPLVPCDPDVAGYHHPPSS